MLARSVRGFGPGHPLRSILFDEVVAVCEGDVPLFSCRADATRLERLGVDIASRSAIACSRERLGRLDDVDRSRQSQMIDAAIALRSFRPGHERPLPAGRAHVDDLQSVALDRAVRVGERLLLDAERGPAGRGLWWYGAGPVDAASRRAALGPVGGELYAGVSGIALAFAALWVASGERRWRRASLDTMRLHVDAITEAPELYAQLAGFGAHEGPAGVALALRTVANLTDLEELDVAATALIDALMGLDPGVDHRHDVVGGLAGTILATTAMVAEPSDEQIATIANWADALAAAAIQPHPADGHERREASPTVVWPSLDPAGELSYAHGSAGIIDALMVAASLASGVSSARQWRQLAADAASTLDDRLRDPTPESPPGRDPRHEISWCSGAVGYLYGLERHASTLDRASTAAEGLLRRVASVDGDRDCSLCCGLAGRLEYWRGRARHAPDDREAAEAVAALRRRFVELLATSAELLAGRAPFLPNRPDTSVPAPGLYQGDAGIAWTLASIAAPSLPVLQRWEVKPVPADV